MVTKWAHLVTGFVVGLLVARVVFFSSALPVVNHKSISGSASIPLAPPESTETLTLEKPVVAHNVLRPQREHRFSKVEVGEDLREIVERRLVGAGDERTFNLLDGTLAVEISLYDGEKASRLFSAEGLLLAEAWKLADGTDVSRDFYPDGPVKGVSLKRRDGSSLLVSFTEMGLQKLRIDGSSEGRKIVTEFNDRGAPIGRIEVDESGIATRRL